MPNFKNSLLSLINENLNNFTSSEKIVADYLISIYPKSLILTASEISNHLNMNISTITRFYNKLGFSSAKEAQNELKKQADYLLSSPLDRYNDQQESLLFKDSCINEVIDQEISNIKYTFNYIDEYKLENIINLLCNLNYSIYIVGDRKQYSIAYYFYNQLNSSRTNVHILKSDNASDVIIDFNKNDLLILFDFRRYPSINENTFKIVEDKEPVVISFIDSPTAPSVKFATHTFLVYTNGISAFDSYTSCISLINLITTLVVKNIKSSFVQRFSELSNTYKKYNTFQII